MTEQPARDVMAGYLRTVRLVKAERERDEARAEVERQKRHRDEAVKTWRNLYHEAIGIPPSEHQARRLEEMATKAEAVAAERDEALAALGPWHAECDKVGLPYDPPALVRHHRANAGMADANWQEVARLQGETLVRVRALADDLGGLGDTAPPPQDVALADRIRAALEGP